MSTPRKALKVQTSPSGRRFVATRDVVRGEMERIRQRETGTDRPVNGNGCPPQPLTPQKPNNETSERG